LVSFLRISVRYLLRRQRRSNCQIWFIQEGCLVNHVGKLIKGVSNDIPYLFLLLGLLLVSIA
jgi:hypothetical protein